MLSAKHCTQLNAIRSSHGVMTHHSFGSLNHGGSVIITGMHIRYLTDVRDIFELCGAVKAWWGERKANQSSP